MATVSNENLPSIPASVRTARDALFAAMEMGEWQVQALDEVPLFADGNLTLARNGFQFETPGGVVFDYRKGGGLSVTGTSSELEDEEALFRWGTVFGAVAWLNELVPIHASAVSNNGRAIAFSADSGGGKSTLAAALSQRGFAHICDDTLVLVREAENYWGLPDGKPLKLWDDAAHRMGARSATPITTVPGKSYVAAENPATEPAPLTDLVFLSKGEEIGLDPIEGGEKLELLAGALYRGFIHAARAGNDEHAQMMFRFASNVRFWRLRRPMDEKHFEAEMDRVKGLLRERLSLL